MADRGASDGASGFDLALLAEVEYKGSIATSNEFPSWPKMLTSVAFADLGRSFWARNSSLYNKLIIIQIRVASFSYVLDS